MEGDREGERSGIGDEIPGLGYFLTDKFNGFLLHAGVKPSLHTEFSRQATKEITIAAASLPSPTVASPCPTPVGILDPRLGENQSTLLHNSNPTFLYCSLQMNSLPFEAGQRRPPATESQPLPCPAPSPGPPAFPGQSREAAKERTRRLGETVVPDDIWCVIFPCGEIHRT